MLQKGQNTYEVVTSANIGQGSVPLYSAYQASLLFDLLLVLFKKYRSSHGANYIAYIELDVKPIKM